MSTVVQTVAAGVLVVVVAACTGSAGAPAEAADPSPSGTVTATATADVAPVVNGPITSAQRHFRTAVSSYHWLAFDGAADRGLFASYVRCADCLPSRGRVRRLIVLGPNGRVATLACPDSQRCHLGDSGSAATLGPGADAVTVEWGHGRLAVIGYDGTVRRRLDVTAALARGDDVTSLAWSPDGSRLAVLTWAVVRRTRLWLVDGDAAAPTLAYTADNPFLGHPVWSPDGQSLLLEGLLPTRDKRRVRSFGADVVALHLSSAGSSPGLTPQVRYRSNRHFDWAGNITWSPDGTRIAARVTYGVVEISAEDGRVLAQHPESRRTSGWLIWTRKDH